MSERIPYRPANGAEGADFMAAWCGLCRLDGDNGCRIAGATMIFGVNEPEYPEEWREDGPQGPRCTAFDALDPMAQPLDPAAVVRPLL